MRILKSANALLAQWSVRLAYNRLMVVQFNHGAPQLQFSVFLSVLSELRPPSSKARYPYVT